MSPRLSHWCAALIAAVLCAGLAWRVRMPLPFDGFAALAAAGLAFLGTLSLVAWMPRHWVWSDAEQLRLAFRAQHCVSEYAADSALSAIVTTHARASALRGTDGPWFVEAHVIRITTDGGIGRPTPEGAHRDGVALVAVVLLDRQGIKGGETRVFEADGPRGERFTMTERGTTLLIDDERTIHESTPVQPLGDGAIGHRDTLVLTWRRGGFQAPD